MIAPGARSPRERRCPRGDTARPGRCCWTAARGGGAERGSVPATRRLKSHRCQTAGQKSGRCPSGRRRGSAAGAPLACPRQMRRAGETSAPKLPSCNTHTGASPGQTPFASPLGHRVQRALRGAQVFQIQTDRTWECVSVSATHLLQGTV